MILAIALLVGAFIGSGVSSNLKKEPAKGIVYKVGVDYSGMTTRICKEN